MVTPDLVVTTLGLQPLPVEGGHWAQTWRDANGTGIYYLVRAPGFSALHRLAHPEIYSFHAGAPARMLLLHPDGSVTRPMLGIDLAAGQRPQVAVPAGVWQATETTGEWSLLGTFMAPPYTDDCVTFGDQGLSGDYPEAATDIARLAR